MTGSQPALGKYARLVAATFTPMKESGEVDLSLIAPMTEALLSRGVQGLYVCGSTGEGFSLSSAERKAVAAEFVRAAAGRVPVIVQVGHESLAEARDLAHHAASVGADAISAIPPTYFRPTDVSTIVECARTVASAAPETDFFYYHIPAKTSVEVSLTALVELCLESVPTFCGVKFSDTRVYDLSLCASRYGPDVTLLYGVDEMLLSGLSAGANGAVGSTYNFLTAEALEVLTAFRAGELGRAQEVQQRLSELINAVVSRGGLPALKAAMNASGVRCGPTRLPLREAPAEVVAELTALMRSAVAASSPN